MLKSEFVSYLRNTTLHSVSSLIDMPRDELEINYIAVRQHLRNIQRIIPIKQINSFLNKPHFKKYEETK